MAGCEAKGHVEAVVVWTPYGTVTYYPCDNRIDSQNATLELERRLRRAFPPFVPLDIRKGGKVPKQISKAFGGQTGGAWSVFRA